MINKKFDTEKKSAPFPLGESLLADIPRRWDLIVIGGGITGAGILREARRAGLSVLLLDRADFTWGTSSRSSKLVHGGLRYLKEGRFLLTKAAVEERERLLLEAPGLVEMLGFLMPLYKDQSPGKAVLGAGLAIYDFMAAEAKHKFYGTADFAMLLPHIRRRGLVGGYRFFDAQVDDARLVLRLIGEAVAEGACALNYVEVKEILRNAKGQAVGVAAEDRESARTAELSAAAVINATGCWAEALHSSPDPLRHIRPLRGSHLVFPSWRLPMAQAVSFFHPADNRPVFIIPWETVILVGTTDIDHGQEIMKEPAAADEEISYLMQGLKEFFPSLRIKPKDAIATFSGIRPVLSKGKLSPSEESRDHIVWADRGLITITGGKLTTFRRLALDALRASAPSLPKGKIDRLKDALRAFPHFSSERIPEQKQ